MTYLDRDFDVDVKVALENLIVGSDEGMANSFSASISISHRDAPASGLSEEVEEDRRQGLVGLSRERVDVLALLHRIPERQAVAVLTRSAGVVKEVVEVDDLVIRNLDDPRGLLRLRVDVRLRLGALEPDDLGRSHD